MPSKKKLTKNYLRMVETCDNLKQIIEQALHHLNCEREKSQNLELELEAYKLFSKELRQLSTDLGEAKEALSLRLKTSEEYAEDIKKQMQKYATCERATN